MTGSVKIQKKEKWKISVQRMDRNIVSATDKHHHIQNKWRLHILHIRENVRSVCVMCVSTIWYWEMGGHNQKCYSSVKIDVGSRSKGKKREKKRVAVPAHMKRKKNGPRSHHIKFI